MRNISLVAERLPLSDRAAAGMIHNSLQPLTKPRKIAVLARIIYREMHTNPSRTAQGETSQA